MRVVQNFPLRGSNRTVVFTEFGVRMDLSGVLFDN